MLTRVKTSCAVALFWHQKLRQKTVPMDCVVGLTKIVDTDPCTWLLQNQNDRREEA